MRHVIVTRVSLLLGLLFLGAAGVFAWLTTGEEPPRGYDAAAVSDGAVLFEEHCGACHSAADLRSSLRGSSAGRRKDLEQFLRHHGDAPPEADRLILDALSRELPQPPG